MRLRRMDWRTSLFGLVAVAAAVPAGAQQPARSGLMADLLRDVTEVEEKVVSLARAIPADKFDWRPGEGVRSVGEVVMHVAADNYFIPTLAGAAAPEATGIKAGDYPTAVAFERRTVTRDEAIAELERSFAFIKRALAEVPESRLNETVQGTMTQRGIWLLATTHLHEHLGQLIAYARTNDIVPPWSRAGG